MRTHIVAAGVLIENGKVLLSRRKQGSHLAGMWEFPGGKAEPGEDPRAALRRELEEELGIHQHVDQAPALAYRLGARRLQQRAGNGYGGFGFGGGGQQCQGRIRAHWMLPAKSKSRGPP